MPTSLLTITVGTHFFQVTPLPGEERIKNLCYMFVKRFLKVDVQGNNRTITTFASSNSRRTWFRFHFNSLPDFLNLLSSHGVKKEAYTVIHLPEPDVPTASLPIKAGWVAKDYQEPIIKYLTEKVGAFDTLSRKWVEGDSRAKLVGIQPGRGKLVRNNTKVKTPFGWSYVQDLRVGSLVLGRDGRYTDVVGVFPEKDVQLYRVRFEDGRKTDVHIGHLWSFVNTQTKMAFTGTTHEMIVALRSQSLSIPLCDPFDEQVQLAHAVEPFVLGKAISKNQLYGPIPDSYLLAGLEDRLNLLRGLLSVGIEIKGDEVLYTTPSRALRGSLRQLVWSLGGKAWQEDKTVRIAFKDLSVFLAPGTLPESYRPHEGFFGLGVVSINQIDVDDATCIAVASEEKLFVCEDYIVTHNTFCALRAISDLGYKFVVIVLARFVEKWAGKWVVTKKKDKKGKTTRTTEFLHGDITKILDIRPEQILTIQSTREMQALTALTRDEMAPYKAVVISNRTFDTYLRSFENAGDDLPALGFETKPDDLWEKLGIGLRLIDEVHMEFHANFRVDLYTHIKRSISLSATLLNRDPTVEMLYKTAYPAGERYNETELDKYIDMFAVMYRIDSRWQYKTSNRGMSSYSHVAFEASIMKNKEFMNSYFSMFKRYIEDYYIRHKKPGNKAIVFCATIEMCTKLAEYLQEFYPDLNIKRFTASDPYDENYQKPDIRVTTIGSGGTGHDIPGLIDNHITVNIDSIQAFIQAFGRLRKIADQDTRAFYYTCEDIQKHVGYHKKKIDVAKQRCKSLHQTFHGIIGERNYAFY